MSTNVVNLDALIPREDFAIEEQPPQLQAIDKISVVHLEGLFFGPDLRKPDFQRETVQWTPDKVVDLVRAFVDADLIPAVILWRAGRYFFVIDGAHRLSALLAWIHDDYGDRKISREYFGGHISSEQEKTAKRTRETINKIVGSYQDYLAVRRNPEATPATMRKRLSNLSINSIIAQWVPATDVKSAENSFFKINQAATPIDPTERRILKARKSATAIASRAITHAGTGHKYWSGFDKTTQVEIEAAGKAIYYALYDPLIVSNAATTLDVPVAGRGYNTLPFVFDLVNQSNGVETPDTSVKTNVVDELPEDTDGTSTVKFLKAVKRKVERITTDAPGSLGLHPVVYFYSRSGTFQPLAFLSFLKIVDELSSKRKLNDFIRIRKDFESFIVKHKEAMSLIVNKLGSGKRSLPWLQKYYSYVMEGLWKNKTSEEIQQAFADNKDFAFLTVPRPTAVRDKSTKAKHAFNSGTKTAAFFAAALPSGTRCAICQGLVHKNSVHIDHVVPVREGGQADTANAQVVHPYCKSGFKESNG